MRTGLKTIWWIGTWFVVIWLVFGGLMYAHVWRLI